MYNDEFHIDTIMRSNPDARECHVKNKKESDTEDHLFLRQDEFEVLEGFQESTLVDWSFFARDNVKALANPKDFISRIYSQKILTPVSD